MTNEHLKNRAQQIIDAIPVLREKEYGWAEIEKMLNEILIELDDSPWHTGKPTENGWYLLECNIGNSENTYFTTDYWNDTIEYWTVNRVIRWQKIDEDKEGK